MTYSDIRVKSSQKERWLIIKHFKLMDTQKLRKLHDQENGISEVSVTDS